MARKLNPKLPRAHTAESETMNRRPHPTAATLYLMQLRAHELKIAPGDHIRLEVDDEAAIEEEPKPVKIVWIDGNK
jgi:hypothetical protein